MPATDEVAAAAVVETDVPYRLDRLPWSRFHWLVVTALGVAWILDGLEVTLVGSLSGALARSPLLRLSGAEIGLAASVYLLGAVSGALLFGWLRIGSAANGSLPSRLRSMRWQPWHRALPGISPRSPSSGFSPARGSAANTPRSMRRSKS